MNDTHLHRAVPFPPGLVDKAHSHQAFSTQGSSYIEASLRQMGHHFYVTGVFSTLHQTHRWLMNEVSHCCNNPSLLGELRTPMDLPFFGVWILSTKLSFYWGSLIIEDHHLLSAGFQCCNEASQHKAILLLVLLLFLFVFLFLFRFLLLPAIALYVDPSI